MASLLTGLLKLVFLPLENHLWHRPSKVMSFHSLHLLRSQFWVPLHLSWHHYQSCHHFVPSCLQSSQIGPWWVIPKFKSSRFKWKTLQYVVRLYLKYTAKPFRRCVDRKENLICVHHFPFLSLAPSPVDPHLRTPFSSIVIWLPTESISAYE